jgi:hypothetical protein
MSAEHDVSEGTTHAVAISFIPHFHAVTNVGKSQFSRISDAAAELIDNSIQACTYNIDEPRTIAVSLFFSKRNAGEGYILVSDNGGGMDVKGLKEFATYSLDQETRGNVATSADRSFISKFGVGESRNTYTAG